MPSPRAILFRLHWALGLTAGLVLAVMGLTGALLSYEEAVTGWVNGDRTAVAVREAPALSPSSLARRVEEQMIGRRVARLTLQADPAASVTVRFARDPASGGRPPSVFADPYDGAVLGPVRGEAAFATILALHRFLLLPGEGGGWGRQITGACAVSLLIFLVTGIVLRWPKVHRARIWLRPSLSRPGRARWWSLHAVAGTWLLPVYGIIALSGLTWSYGWFKDGANRLLVGTEAAAKPSRQGLRANGLRADGPPAVDAAWGAFRAGEGRDAVRAQILLPEEGRQPIRIRWFARDDDRPAARNEARYDPSTAAPISAERASDQPLGKRMAGNMLEVHRGRFFGAPFALLFCLAALAMPGFAATGLALYVLRRRAAGRRQARRPLVPAAAE
ncbi:PepSY-associated TM helix domain-containing protein [Methylobacterium sp. J-076]|uniref:PepSY-associated TM helix domain-containing protein n=1 Tax=Methylobacterium sp. J-076 TaxID=2836655 RepID=UPI001FBAA780|nr:PepSY-associated TM helix domain-containing protein [Methylobacterium sp. J-076]MCJ2015090.1 PepSY domain-containing protein [Methylobacterium sp. J-076]